MALFGLIVFACSSSLAETRSLLIVHTNDLHGHIHHEANENGLSRYAGASRIGALIRELKSKRNDVVALDAGDAVSGTPVSTLFMGTPIFEVMSAMQYDAGNLGNHEFDYGYRQITEFRETADFPLLSSNAYTPEGKRLADDPSMILEINRIRAGVIGVITPDTPHIIIPRGNENVRIDDAMHSIHEQVSKLKPITDLIILLSHLGYEGDRAVAESISDIDLIIGGHSHTLLKTAIKVNKTWIVQAHRYGTHAGIIELTMDTNEDRIIAFHSSLISADRLTRSDPKVDRKVRYWEDQLSRKLGATLAVSGKIISGNELRSLIEHIMTEATGADLGYYNTGGIRDSIPSGAVTARHIWNIEPFGNTLVTMRLTGFQLKQLLLREAEVRP
ncbi:MAG: bifunctional metallophosphatase/5'-nucleotidase, partial [Gammaproteobacteria bacterium]|nr:bifunctional metallophosphatase/5'-nucleotidase [Gammaproteobacteria bacterium]